MKRIMGVYDVDPFYAERFAEFVNQKDQVPFTVVPFGTIERLRAFTEQQEIELLLVGDEISEEQLKEVRAGQTVRLSESREAVGVTKDVIYKYQSSDAVLREVMARYQVKPELVPLAAAGVKSRIIGVYSPINRCGKTSFCLTMGQILSREAQTLYLSLEEYSGLSKLTGTVYGDTLSDLLYYYMQGEYSRTRLSAALYNWGGLDYVPPAAYAEDLEDVRGADAAGLVSRIAADGLYETILLDIGHVVRGMEPLWAICDRIYMPVKEDCVSSVKLEAWQEYLKESGRSRLWERIQILKLPMPGRTLQTETYLEQLLWGEMGDFVRDLLKGQQGGRVL